MGFKPLDFVKSDFDREGISIANFVSNFIPDPNVTNVYLRYPKKWGSS